MLLTRRASGIPLKNPEQVREKEETGGIKNSQEHEGVARVQREERRSEWRFEGECGTGVLH